MFIKKAILFLFVIIGFLSCSKDDDSESVEDFQIDFSEINFGHVTATITSFNDNVETISSGIVWGVDEIPVIENNNSLLSAVTTGSFQETIYGLKGNTTYNFRAFSQTENSIEYGSVFSVVTSENCAGEVFQNDVVLRSQKDIDNFNVSNICSINGNLELTSENPLDPITNISKFSNLQNVKSLLIYNNPELKNLLGLQNIETITEFLSIQNNDLLETLEHLSSITGEFQFASIVNNSELIDLTGLNGITGLTGKNGGLSIRNNSKLEVLNAFNELEKLDNFNLSGNPSLMTIDFPSLNGAINLFDIKLNGSLVSISNLGELEKIDFLFIEDCFKLNNLNGFDSLKDLSNFYIGFTEINNINFFSNLTQGDSATFSNNENLTNFCSLTSLIQNGGFESFETFGNAYNPSRKDILNGNCSF